MVKIQSKFVLFTPSAYFLRVWISAACIFLTFVAYAASYSISTIFLISIISLFFGGDLFMRGAILELKHWYVGFNAFITVSAASSFIFGVLNTFDGAQVLTVAGGLLILPVLFLFANVTKILELNHIKKSFRFMEGLDILLPRAAVKIVDKKEIKVFAGEVKKGDLIIIKAGEKVSHDAEIIKGSTLLDEYLLTGNITLTAKQKGDKIFAGTVNKGSEITAKVSADKNSSQMAKVFKAVKASEMKKISFQSTLEKYSLRLIIFFVLLSAAQLTWGLLYEKGQNITYWILLSLFFMSAASTLTYIFAVLMPIWFFEFWAKREGILVNNPQCLGLISKSDRIFIDKTGTLTTGQLEVSEVVPVEGISKNEILRIAATAQQGTKNIFSSAISEYIKDKRIFPENITSMELYPSFGTMAKTAGHETIFVGRKTWLENNGIVINKKENELKKTVFYVSKNSKFIGCIYFSDKLRANAKETIVYLKSHRKAVAIISGDNSDALKIVAEKVGAEEFYGDMYPQSKLEKIAQSHKNGELITMIGDGFNDILALLQADSSIIFAGGKSMFSGWVDISISNRNFNVIQHIFEFYRKQTNIIRQNILLTIFFSLFVYLMVVIMKYNILWYEFASLLAVFVGLVITNSGRLLR